MIRQRFAQIAIEAQVLRLLAYRGLTSAMKSGEPGPEGSLGKWLWADINQALTTLAMDVKGPRRAARRRHVDLPLPARPRELDRGRHDRDPQEHRRRTSAGAAARMNFDLTEDQREIRRTARDFLAARYTPREDPRDRARRRSRTRTGTRSSSSAGRTIAELGIVELAVVAEELGYALAPSPLASHWAAKLLHPGARGPRDGRDVGRRRRADPATLRADGRA